MQNLNFCPKVQFWWNLLQQWIWIFAPKMRLLRTWFFEQKLGFCHSVCCANTPLLWTDAFQTKQCTRVASPSQKKCICEQTLRPHFSLLLPLFEAAALIYLLIHFLIIADSTITPDVWSKKHLWYLTSVCILYQGCVTPLITMSIRCQGCVHRC